MIAEQEAVEITRNLGDLLPGDLLLPDATAKIPVKGIALDSREIKSGWLFLAFPGAAVDGRQFIDKAIANGACAIISEGNVARLQWMDAVPLIQFEELQARASEIAGRFYGKPSSGMDVIGVTGTNGKSTCVSLIAQLCNLLHRSAWQLGTVGFGDPVGKLTATGLTTPDAVSSQQILYQARRRKIDVFAMEVSSHAIAQNRVQGVCFQGGVFTNITHDHLDYHKSFEEYSEVKSRFLTDKNMKFVVLNLDDALGKRITKKGLETEAQIIAYSLSDNTADIYAESVTASLDGVQGSIVSTWGNARFSSPLIGDFNVSNLLAAIAAVCASGESFVDVIKAIPQLVSVPGRMQKVRSALDVDKKFPNVFVDYAHTPDALENILRSAKKLTRGKLSVVFGCGGNRDQAKRPMMGEIASRYADNVIVTSDNPRHEDPLSIIFDVESGIVDKTGFRSDADRNTAILSALSHLQKEDCLIVAGKGHESYQIVGDEKLPFDDYALVCKALENRYYEHARGLG